MGVSGALAGAVEVVGATEVVEPLAPLGGATDVPDDPPGAVVDDSETVVLVVEIALDDPLEPHAPATTVRASTSKILPRRTRLACNPRKDMTVS